MVRTMEHKTATVVTKDDYEVNEFKREILEKIVKKLQNGKASGAENTLSEL